ncbi:MAG: GlsB/YeaQ/YmgE family stress response membrane protein [Planctomycetota bacterium]
MIDLLAWAIFGLIAGLVARLFVGSPEPMGCLGTIAVGVVGSVVGGTLGRLLFTGTAAGLHTGGFVSSVLGAILVLLLLRRR